MSGGLLAALVWLLMSASGQATAATPAAIQVTNATVPVTGTVWTPPSPSYKIVVDKDGIIQLSYADLQAAGLPVDSLNPKTFRLYWMAQEVPIQVDGESDNVFNAADRVLFYGRNLDSLFYEGIWPDNKYTGENVYWLTYGGGNGLRMSPKASVGGGTAAGPYLHKDHFERNISYFTDRPYHVGDPMPQRYEPGADRWQWIWVRSGLTFRNFPFSLSNIPGAAQDGLATVRLQGTSGRQFLFQPPTPHHIKLYMNGTPIYDNPAAGYDFEAFTITATVPHNTLTNGTNFLKVELNPVGSSSEVYINWLELSYRDSYVAENSALIFDGETGAGPWNYTVSSFGDSDIRVYDVTDIFNPMVFTGATVGASDVTFGDSSGGRRYIAASANGWLAPLRIEAYAPQTSAYSPADLLSTINGADWIAIAHKDVWSEAVRLATYRSTKYRVALVDVDQIYAQFNGGMRSSESIREFLRYVYNNWTAPKNQFVLLFGDGTSDMRNYRFSAPTLIPPFLVAVEPTLGETAADNRYVTLVGNDLLPDMSIGRFPVDTLPEAALMVSKTIKYESTPPFNDWNLNVLLIADDGTGGGGDFFEFSNILADGYSTPVPISTTKFLPAPYTSTKIYLGYNINNEPGTCMTAAECQQDIIDGVNGGALFTSYVGHAQTGNWATEPLVDAGIVNQFTNYEKLSIFLGMACFEGFFHQPDLQPLAETYLLHPLGGAVASWSPTGFGVATGHDWLEQGFFLSVFQDKETILGKASDAGKLYLHNNAPASKYDDLIDTFLLLGDPALHIQGYVAPTAVEMAGLSAQTSESGVRVQWATANEADILGFEVLRSQSADGPFEAITEMIQARAPGSPVGNSYSFVDATTDPAQSYWYKLKVLTLDSGSEEYGLAAVVPAIKNSLFLPTVER
ncbi:MAG: C25 family cysteine peptidase [Caldilineaceae bacterium]